jgi:hypothetical protein
MAWRLLIKHGDNLTLFYLYEAVFMITRIKSKWNKIKKTEGTSRHKVNKEAEVTGKRG